MMNANIKFIINDHHYEMRADYSYSEKAHEDDAVAMKIGFYLTRDGQEVPWKEFKASPYLQECAGRMVRNILNGQKRMYWDANETLTDYEKFEQEKASLKAELEKYKKAFKVVCERHAKAIDSFGYIVENETLEEIETGVSAESEVSDVL